MKKLLTLVFAMLLGASLSFAQAGTGAPATTNTPTKTTGKTSGKKGSKTKGKKGVSQTPPLRTRIPGQRVCSARSAQGN